MPSSHRLRAALGLAILTALTTGRAVAAPTTPAFFGLAVLGLAARSMGRRSC